MMIVLACVPDSPTQRGRNSLVKTVLASLYCWNVLVIHKQHRSAAGTYVVAMCSVIGIQTVDHNNIMTVGQNVVRPNMAVQYDYIVQFSPDSFSLFR